MSRVAYVLRPFPSVDQLAKVASGVEPQADFSSYIDKGLAEPLAMVPHSSPSLCGRLLAKTGGFGAAIRLLRGPGRGFDAFITTGEDVGIPLALSMQALRDRRPIHIITHGHYIGGVKFDVVARLLRGRARVHWHPLSTSLRDVLIHRFGFRPDQVHATGYAVDTRFFTPTDEKPSAIVSAGLARRDYRTLVEAVRGMDVPVRIAAGSTWFQEALNVDTKRLPASIEVKSQDNYRNLRDLYASARFVVVPMQNVQHACGYAVIGEAMAMGKAVIATRTTANSDFVIEGETGFLVEPGDVTGLRNCMQRLLNDPDLARRLGENARQLMERSYRLEDFCARMSAAVAQS